MIKSILQPASPGQSAQESEEFQFVWLDSTNRFDLESMQRKLVAIIQASDNNKTLVGIGFAFSCLFVVLKSN